MKVGDILVLSKNQNGDLIKKGHKFIITFVSERSLTSMVKFLTVKSISTHKTFLFPFTTINKYFLTEKEYLRINREEKLTEIGL